MYEKEKNQTTKFQPLLPHKTSFTASFANQKESLATSIFDEKILKH